jgi:hypothetical protein
MPIDDPGVGGYQTMAWTTRAEPRRSVPMLILSPPDDHAFVTAARNAVQIGMTPAGLEVILRARYPMAVVRQRELIGESFTIWYVYRDGHWIPPRSRSTEAG